MALEGWVQKWVIVFFCSAVLAAQCNGTDDISTGKECIEREYLEL